MLDEVNNRCVLPDNCPCPQCEDIPENCSNVISQSISSNCSCPICRGESSLLTCIEHYYELSWSTDCPDGQVFKECKGCPETCSESLNSALTCPDECSSGCQCPNDTLYDEVNSRCVLKEECPGTCAHVLILQSLIDSC